MSEDLSDLYPDRISPDPDPDRPCIAPLNLGPVACAYGHEHPNEVSHYAVGESGGMHWSLFWWDRAAVSERPGETASTRGHRRPPAVEPSLADRLRELIAFVDDGGRSYRFVHIDSLRALLEPEA